MSKGFTKDRLFIQLHTRSSVILRNSVYVAGTLAVLLGAMFMVMLDSSDLSISLTSADFYLTDNNKGCIVEPNAAYISFEICNTSSQTLTNIWASLGNFTNSEFGLAGNQHSDQFVDELAVGACKTLFWYTYYDCSSSLQSTDMTIKVYDSSGDTVSQTHMISNISTIDAGAGGKTLTSVLTGSEELGTTVTFDCEYSLGSLGDGASIVFQPVGNLDFDADCFQLTGSEVLYSDISDVAPGDRDQLFYPSVSKHAGNSHIVQIRYFFTTQCVLADTTRAKPYSGAISGQNYKRYNLGEDEVNNVIAMPITYLSIGATWEGKAGKISWEADGAREGESYLIQRSIDGQQFEQIDQRLTEEVQLSPTQFAYLDYSADRYTDKTIYYRLQHIDLDGVFFL